MPYETLSSISFSFFFFFFFKCSIFTRHSRLFFIIIIVDIYLFIYSVFYLLLDFFSYLF